MRARVVVVFSLIVLLFTLHAGDVLGQSTVHHWRFEEGPDFLLDSVGSAHLRPTGASVGALSIPLEGRGELFPPSFEGLGNTSVAEFTSTLEGYVADNAALDLGDFTLELFANVENFANASNIIHLISQASPRVVPYDTFYSFQIRNDRWGQTVPGELNVNFGDDRPGSPWHGSPSGIIIKESVDYYLSASFDYDARRVNYYVQDLANKSVQVSSIPYRHDGLHKSETFLIGDVGNCCLTDGLIDEIRVSSANLDFPDTLIAQAASSETDYLDVETIIVGVSDVYGVTENNVTDRMLSARTNVRSSEKSISKFVLPEFVDPLLVESAQLRFYVEGVDDAPTDLTLSHSLSDNDFEQLIGDFENDSYVATGQTLFSAGDEAGQYFDVDVTDLVLENYQHDGEHAVAAFRLESLGDGRVRVSMPRSVDQQPLLVLSLRNGVVGDCNGDGELAADDIDLLSEAIRAGRDDITCDLNLDGIVDAEDRRVWVQDIKQTWFGDADLDGQFSSGDLIHVFQNSKYELGESAGWAEGDWNGDGVFSTGDLIVAFQDGGYEQGPRGQLAAAVPEPTTSLSLIVGLWCIGLRKWRRD